jgi:Type IV secretory system Conjugative DNA transfer
MATDGGDNAGKGVWGFVKSTYKSAKNSADGIAHKNRQNRIRSILDRAQEYTEFEECQAAFDAIPENWETMEMADLKELADGAIAELEQEITRSQIKRENIRLEKAAAEREAEEQAVRDKRYFEVISLLNDPAAVATFNAGAIMDESEHKTFKHVLNSRKPDGSGMLAAGIGAGVGVMASNRYPNRITFGCIIGQIDDSDRQLLRVAAVLMRYGIIKALWFEKAFAGAQFYAGDQRVFDDKLEKDKSRSGIQADIIALDTLKEALPSCIFDSNILQQEVVSLATETQRDSPTSQVVQELANVAGGGAIWFNSADAVGSIYQLEPGKGLFLGQLEDGGFLHYDGEGSLFTIAPPGSGKTQCQVMPNLVMYDGPAIVLDVKGECYQQTAGVRSRVFGPVVRFAPDDWDNSAHYNPLDFVRNDARYLASDARKLADMLIVPQATGDNQYWEQRGRDILAALIGFVAHQFDAHERNMKSVMDLLSPSAKMLDQIIVAMRETGISFLERSANQIEGMSEKQLSSIFDSARSQLSVWDLGELDPITDRSDWHPRDFKEGSKPLTLYLCVGPADIERFASVLRVIIGQHLDYFMDVLPDNVDKPIVFFLDEAPQLGSFEPLPKASALGRQYGLRLWLFAQNRNQVEEAYKNAETILGNAVVQCWMNPDETAAFHLEKNLGITRSLFDGRERPLVLSHELRGPEFKDTIIVVGRGEKPAKLSKHFAYEDNSLKDKMGIDVIGS